MQPQARTEQFFQDVEHGFAAHDLVENFVHLVRRLDTADARAFRGVARLQVIDVGVFEGFGRSRDQFRDHRANLGKRILPQNLRHHDHAIALISLHILPGDHLDSRSMFTLSL